MKKTIKAKVKVIIENKDKIHTSFTVVEKAFNQVRNELIAMKVLWKDSRLDEVNCVYLPIAKAPLSALGGIEGLYDGCRKTIEFPSVFFPIIDLEEKLKIKATPADVIRHEFGHALAEQYPEVLNYFLKHLVTSMGI